MADADLRTSDEATGLPPLHELGDDETLLVLAWDAGEGLARAHDGEPVPVRYLHCRGLVRMVDDPDGVEWAQVHLAVPVEHALEVAAALAKGTTEQLDEGDGRG